MPRRAGEAREFLLDVSRLIWRNWRGRLPTGIDRVCEAYVDHFGSRAQAVVQRRGLHAVLSPAASDRLFAAIRAHPPQRTKLLVASMAATPSALAGRGPRARAIYINVGHTGLDEPSLPSWVARHRLRAVYLIHDLIPLSHPQFCREGEAAKHARRMGNVLDSAAGVIGNSQATLDDLDRFAAQTGKSMPPSVAAWISGGKFKATVEAKTVGRPFFVSVGTIEGRKNHQLLLDVWRKLVAEKGADTPLLVIIGQRGWQAEQVFAQLDDLAELEGHVLEVDGCGDAELTAWMAGARAVLMPSFAEGFGLPLIEALETGTPVIAADLLVFREVAGEIPVYLDPRDEAKWTFRIEQFAENNSVRARQIEAMTNFRAPTWDDHFAKIEPWLASL